MNSENEVWKVIPGISLYEASTEGRIRRFSTKRVRHPCPTKKGYLQVRLRCDDGKTRTFLVHRLILLTFRGPSSLETNHRFAIKSDNRLRKLEYATSLENNQHAESLGLKNHPKGSLHPRSKLDELDVKKIRILFAFGKSSIRISKLFGVSESTISDIVYRRKWKHVK